MNHRPQNPDRARKGLILIAVMGIGVCGLSLSRVFRVTDVTPEKAPDIELSSSDPVSVASPERSASAAGKGITESNTDRLVWLIREGLASSDNSATILVCGNEWIELLKTDTASALGLFKEVADRSQREQLLPLLLKECLKSDVLNALNWAAQLPDASERNLALRSGLTELAESNPAKAAEMTEQFYSGGQKEIIFQEIGRQWATQNLDEAVVWAKARPSDENRDKLFLEMVLVAAKSNPEQAAQITVANILPGVIQATAALSVVDEWAQTDFAAATEWVNQFPECQTRDQAVLHLGRMAFYQSQRSSFEPTPSP